MLKHIILGSDVHNYTLIMMVKVRVMSGSNYIIPTFIVATESIGQIKWLTDSKVVPTCVALMQRFNIAVWRQG